MSTTIETLLALTLPAPKTETFTFTRHKYLDKIDPE